jgi:twinkle protein
MGQCVEKLPCEDCGGSDCLQSFYDDIKDTHYSICFGGCGMAAKGNPYAEGEGPKVEPKTPEQIMQEVKLIQKCAAFKGLEGKPTWRGIPIESFRSWGVRTLISEYDGITPYALGFGYTSESKLVGWKCIPLKGKNMFSLGDTKDSDMFGWERANKIGGKRLYITEGEYDAIALDYCLVQANKNSKFSKKGYAVVSVTSGGGSIVKNLKKLRKKIRKRFSEVVLVLDNDAVGDAAEKEAQKVWPEVLRVDKPTGCKDANDAVKQKLHIEMAQLAMWEAHKLPIQGVIRVSDVLEAALAPVVYGLSYPYEDLTKMTYGQRFGEAVCLGAGVGTGKTVTAHQFGAHNMMHHREPCFMVLLEEQNHDTVKNIASKIDSIPYNNPNVTYDKDRFISTCESLQSKLFMWESEGDQNLRFDMDEILAAVRFNAMEYGCRFAYIDNFTRLVDHLSPSEANEFINKYASIIENLAAQLGIHIMTYSHLNPVKDGGFSHEAGGAVYASQFSGSRGIMRSFPMLMSFRRNKHANEEQGKHKNNSLLGVIKNRKYGNEGEIKTQYKPQTGQLLEYEWEGTIENDHEKKKR